MADENPFPVTRRSKAVPPPTVEVTAPPTAAAEYPLLQPDASDMISILEDNLSSGQGLDVLKLPRIKVGAGGSTNWRIITPEGEDSAKEVDGIIVAFRQARVFWLKPYGATAAGGRKPPDCSSKNGFIGEGNPGGPCNQCPYNQFGTAVAADGRKTSGKACKELRQLLVLRRGDYLPHLVAIPSGSLGNFDRYTMDLIRLKLAYWHLVTRLVLEPAVNESGIGYARAAFRTGQRLTPDEQASLRGYHKHMVELLKPTLLNVDDYEIVDDKAAAVPPQTAQPQPQPQVVEVPAVSDEEVPF